MSSVTFSSGAMLGALLAVGAPVLTSGQGPEPWIGTYDSRDFHINSSFDGTVRVNGQDVVSDRTVRCPTTIHVVPALLFSAVLSTSRPNLAPTNHCRPSPSPTSTLNPLPPHFPSETSRNPPHPHLPCSITLTRSPVPPHAWICHLSLSKLGDNAAMNSTIATLVLASRRSGRTC